MPCDYSKYPKDWKAIRAEVLERASHKCEQCAVKNHAWVFRGVWGGIPVYQYADAHFYNADTGEYYGFDTGAVDQIGNRDKATRVILTISHTDHDVTNNGTPGDRPNLKALCQRCHLRHDHHLHQANAKATRERNAGLASLFTTT